MLQKTIGSNDHSLIPRVLGNEQAMVARLNELHEQRRQKHYPQKSLAQSSTFIRTEEELLTFLRQRNTEKQVQFED